jgi:Lrp/AsnC family transcriptional regulator
MDNKDKAILTSIQENADVTVSELADQVGLSKSACWRRIQNLEEAGIIGAKVTLLNQQALGLNLTVFTAVRTHEHSSEWFEQFHRVTTQMPNVMEVHRLSGDIDYLIRAVVPDMNSYDGMYRELIGKVNLFDVSSSFSMETIKYTTALPLDYL